MTGHLHDAARGLLAAFEARAAAGWHPSESVEGALATLAADLTGLETFDERFAAISESLGLDRIETSVLAVALLAEIHLGAATAIGAMIGGGGGGGPAPRPTHAMGGGGAHPAARGGALAGPGFLGRASGGGDYGVGCGGGGRVWGGLGVYEMG